MFIVVHVCVKLLIYSLLGGSCPWLVITITVLQLIIQAISIHHFSLYILYNYLLIKYIYNV